jgi:ferric-chelate reductase
MATVGDFTKEVHRRLHRPCVRSGWVYGPFPSPFSTGDNFENLITVASGIGITPAISTIVSDSNPPKLNPSAFNPLTNDFLPPLIPSFASLASQVHLAEHRKVHLIWVCRDADLVEFYMKRIPFDDDAWSWIFYTGKVRNSGTKL